MSSSPEDFAHCPTSEKDFTNAFNSVLIPLNYVVIGSSIFISIVIVSMTIFSNIPGRTFRLFIYNSYVLNGIAAIVALVYFLNYATKSVSYENYGNELTTEKNLFNLITSN